jgi:hypothetical protein
MKRIFTKLKFKLASWLWNQDIVAPQMCEYRSHIIVPSDATDEDIMWYKKQQQKIKDYKCNKTKK